MASTEIVVAGDVVQITDAAHAWYPALLIVDEIKSFGVQAYCLIPTNNAEAQSCGAAYIRLKFGQFEFVGKTKIARE